eukprot:6228327-Prymnesium_polylepis.1
MLQARPASNRIECSDVSPQRPTRARSGATKALRRAHQPHPKGPHAKRPSALHRYPDPAPHTVPIPERPHTAPAPERSRMYRHLNAPACTGTWTLPHGTGT